MAPDLGRIAATAQVIVEAAVDLVRAQLWHIADRFPQQQVQLQAGEARLLERLAQDGCVWLLAIGDTAPADVPDNLRCIWIGGRAAYSGLLELDLER